MAGTAQRSVRARASQRVVRDLSRPVLSASTLDVGRDLLDAAHRHRLGAHAVALAYRVLISLVPLALLSIALMGAFGLESVWQGSISPTLHRHLMPSVAAAADDTAQGIFERNGAVLLALATVMVVWNTFRAMREVEHTLDEIHEKQRPARAFLPGVGRRLALAGVVDVCILGALGLFVAAPRVVDDGTVHQVLVVLRWLPALLLLWLAVAALFRYAPAERPQTRWASGGSALVVGGWLVASVAFGAWSASVASYKTALGTLTAFLVLTAYTQAVAYVFVLGAQLDETLRRRESGSRASRR